MIEVATKFVTGIGNLLCSLIMASTEIQKLYMQKVNGEFENNFPSLHNIGNTNSSLKIIDAT